MLSNFKLEGLSALTFPIGEELAFRSFQGLGKVVGVWGPGAA